MSAPEAPRDGILDPAAAELQIYLFGSPRIVHAGRPLAISRQQVRALLYRLAARLEPVSRDHLSFLFWPDVPDATARRNLTQLLSHLRRALPDAAFLDASTEQIRLDPMRVWSDVAAFTRLSAGDDEVDADSIRRVVAHYAGPFLDGISSYSSAEWENWMLAERQALEHSYLDALTTLIKNATTRGAYGEAIDYAQRYLAIDELAEEIHQQLIQLYAANGDRSAALKQYETCAVVLERELGVSPLPETHAAYEAALAERPHNLPVPPTSLIGRKKERRMVSELLRDDDTWLVTLTGAGGSGKTRLSLELAHDVLPYFANGVFFVELAPLRDASLVVSTVAQTLGLQDMGRQSLEQTLAMYLQDKHILLVLDNFEHLLAAAPDIARLRARAPRLVVLTTSRERLNLRGECEVPVPPLRLAETEEGTPLDSLAQSEAVRLFIARAREAQLNFDLTADNAPAVSEICRRLDGLPLAVELAAARVKILPPEALLEHLGSPLDLLTIGARDLPDRHQTLRATIAWSYNLLSDAERRLFRRLGVFAGGCTLESAQAICDLDGDLGIPVLDGLASLVDKNLLQNAPMERDGAPRFVMLETVREYAVEQLEASGEAGIVYRQHADYFLDLAETTDSTFEAPNLGNRLDRLDRERDNLHLAFRSLVDEQSFERALRLAAALGQFWTVRGYWSEARERLERVLARSPTTVTPACAKALLHLGRIVDFQSGAERAQGLFEESLGIYRTLGDRRGMARALFELANAQTDLARTQRLIEQSLALYRELEDREGMAEAFALLGNLARFQGDYTSSRAYYLESLALLGESGHELLRGSVLYKLGNYFLEQSELSTARRYYEESLALAEAAGSKQMVRLVAIHNLGEVARLQGNYSTARVYFEEAITLTSQVGNQLHIAHGHVAIGNVAQAEGDYAEARASFTTALRFYAAALDWNIDTQDVTLGIRYAAFCIASCATFMGIQHKLLPAVRLFGGLERLLATVNIALPANERERCDQQLADLREQLEEDVFSDAWTAGQAMKLDALLAYAIECMD